MTANSSDDDAWFPPLLFRDAGFALRHAWQRYRLRTTGRDADGLARAEQALLEAQTVQAPSRSRPRGNRN